jgi:hypothetical protein
MQLQAWPCLSPGRGQLGAGPASPSEKARDGGSTILSPPQPELVLTLVVSRASCQQLWAATRGASKILWNDAWPPPMGFMLRLAAAHTSGLQGDLEVHDVGPVPLRCRSCCQLQRKGHRQHMLRIRQPGLVYASVRPAYIGADCCAPLAAASLQKDVWEDLTRRVTTDIGSHSAQQRRSRLRARQSAPTSQPPTSQHPARPEQWPHGQAVPDSGWGGQWEQNPATRWWSFHSSGSGRGGQWEQDPATRWWSFRSSGS